MNPIYIGCLIFLKKPAVTRCLIFSTPLNCINAPIAKIVPMMKKYNPISGRTSGRLMRTGSFGHRLNQDTQRTHIAHRITTKTGLFSGLILCVSLSSSYTQRTARDRRKKIRGIRNELFIVKHLQAITGMQRCGRKLPSACMP